MPSNTAHEAASQAAQPNLEQAVPFFMVTDMQVAMAFYVEGLAFQLQRKWTPNGVIEWCMLERDGVRLMLQALQSGRRDAWLAQGAVGRGVTIYVFCKDALAIYREARAKGLSPERPVVGNGMWVTDFVDPDGYRVSFESPTDTAEETIYDG